MKKQKHILYFSLILFALHATSCVQINESLSTPVQTISIPPTNNVEHSPAFTLMPADSASSTSTPDPFPTLTNDEARSKFLKMLSTNGGCQLPCLWGISPMNSSFEEARSILFPFSILSDSVYLDAPGPGSILPRYTEGNLEIYTRITFLINSDNNFVNRIVFNTEAHRLLAGGGYEDVFDSDFFGDTIIAYTLPHVLLEQGIPTSVKIATFGGPLTRGGTGGFDILLLYPDKGILINYTTQMQLIGEVVQGCLKNAHVEMELYPPGESSYFFEAVESTDWSIKMDYYKSIDEVTLMSVDEFYKTFREPNDKCIETPANLWALPEP